jgi:hypothetical protein
MEGSGQPARGQQSQDELQREPQRESQREPYRGSDRQPAEHHGPAADSATHQFAPVALAVTPVSVEHQESPERSTIEVEQLREFQVRETPMQETPAPSRGYAPAVPVKIEWPSDLQQVESDPDKIQAVEHQAPQQVQSTPRPKRVRQPLPPVNEEPLVQIETDRSETQASGSGEKTPA